MKRELFNKDLPIEDRVSRLESVVRKVAMRSKKVASAIITPYPISSSFYGDDVRGTILRYMFPCNGSVTKGMIKFGAKPKKGVAVDLKLSNRSRSDVRSFTISTAYALVEPSPRFEISAGDCLEISLSPSAEEQITEVWIAMLWTPSVTNVDIHEVLIEELEKGLDDLSEA